MYEIILLNAEGMVQDNFNRVLTHELAHGFDGENYKYSNDKIYESLFDLDFQRLKNKKYAGSLLYISPYSRDFTEEAKNGGKGNYRVYSEDFAECVVSYFHEPEKLFYRFPHKSEYINNIFKKYEYDYNKNELTVLW